jgi:hypothetical protein
VPFAGNTIAGVAADTAESASIKWRARQEILTSIADGSGQERLKQACFILVVRKLMAREGTEVSFVNRSSGQGCSEANARCSRWTW